MPLEFNETTTKQMNELQIELSTVLVRARDARVEAGIAAFACIRCARALLDQYPDRTRDALVETVIAFLRREGGDISHFTIN